MTRFVQALTQWRSARLAAIFIVFAIGVVAAVLMFERMLLNQVQAVTETANVAFTRIFVNEAWDELKPMMDLEAKAHPRENPSLRLIDLRVRRLTNGTDLVKVKIYNMQGLTIYSSDPTQLGENKASNKGFQEASQGQVASETTYRGKFGGFDGEIYKRNMVSSYVPVKGIESIEAVVEVYVDRTTSVESVDAAIRSAWTYFGPGTGIVFLFVLLLSRSGHRDKTMRTAKTSGEGEQTLSDTSNPDAPAALLWEATQALNADCKQLELAALPHQNSTPVSEAWQAMTVPMQSLRTRIDELMLIQKPEQSCSLSTNTSGQPLGTLVEAEMAAFRKRNADRDIELSGHVAPMLAQQSPGLTVALARLVGLMLDEASRRTGPGTLRLNIQPSGEDAMQIEVVGTRNSTPNTDVSNAVHSLTLSAARSLARALNGSVESASSSAHGPWLSAKLPISSGAKAPFPPQ